MSRNYDDEPAPHVRIAHSPAESGTGAVLERGLDTSNGLDFVREHLALVGKTLFLVSFGFYLFLLASMVLVGDAPAVPAGARRVAEVLLSQEGRELRIGPGVRPRG